MNSLQKEDINTAILVLNTYLDEAHNRTKVKCNHREENVVKQYRACNPVSKRCMLCLNEKLVILENEGNNLLNKWS